MNSNPPSARPRPYRRSKTNKVLGGVAGGFGEYFGVDPVFFRLGIVVGSVMTGGAVAIAYVALVLIREDDPEATPAQPAAA